MKSKLLIEEKVDNDERVFGSNPVYYPAMIINRDESKTPALFTTDQIETAIERAIKNPEDISEKESFLKRLFGWNLQ